MTIVTATSENVTAESAAASAASVKNLSALFDAARAEPEGDEDVSAASVARRSKQIELTKQTPIYQSFVARRAPAERLPSDPRTPRVTQRCSKRAWLGQVSKWRKELHALHAEPPADAASECQTLDKRSS